VGSIGSKLSDIAASIWFRALLGTLLLGGIVWTARRRK
jgi:hypothetical protein